MYDPKMNQWKFVTDMNHARSDASATCFNGKIYIVGGFNGIFLIVFDCFLIKIFNFRKRCSKFC